MNNKPSGHYSGGRYIGRPERPSTSLPSLLILSVILGQLITVFALFKLAESSNNRPQPQINIGTTGNVYILPNTCKEPIITNVGENTQC